MENTEIQTVIELVKENQELKRGLGDIFFYIIEAKKGREHISMANDACLIKTITDLLSELNLPELLTKKNN